MTKSQARFDLRQSSINLLKKFRLHHMLSSPCMFRQSAYLLKMYLALFKLLFFSLRFPFRMLVSDMLSKKQIYFFLIKHYLQIIKIHQSINRNLSFFTKQVPSILDFNAYFLLDKIDQNIHMRVQHPLQSLKSRNYNRISDGQTD